MKQVKDDKYNELLKARRDLNNVKKLVEQSKFVIGKDDESLTSNEIVWEILHLLKLK